jgi:catechol 2,3-dioxygenase-like lactoylglutathione lyase family enzyme
MTERRKRGENDPGVRYLRETAGGSPYFSILQAGLRCDVVNIVGGLSTRSTTATRCSRRARTAPGRQTGDLAKSTRFYSWLFGAPPKEWTHRYSTFVNTALGTNFVVVVSDGKELHHDTLYHLGIAVTDKAAVIRAFHLAREAGIAIEKPPRTTWRGTPLHELWLTDPDGTLIEIYARLTDEELAQKPDDLEPVLLV